MLLFIFLLSQITQIASINLRIMQYNVEWMFLQYYANMNCPGNGCTWHNISIAEKHMNQISKTIQSLHPSPDIINFCEVEGIYELNTLKNMTTNLTNHTSFFIQGTDTSTGQNVGLISNKQPIINLYRSHNSIYVDDATEMKN